MVVPQRLKRHTLVDKKVMGNRFDTELRTYYMGLISWTYVMPVKISIYVEKTNIHTNTGRCGTYLGFYWVPTRADGKYGKPLVSTCDSPVTPGTCFSPTY